MDQVNQILVSNETLKSNFLPAREWIFPLSFSQQRLWLLEQLDPGSTSYSIPWALRLTGALHAEALEKSLNEIVRRHEALRSTFREVNGEAMQVVTETVTIPLVLSDLTGSPAGERESAALAIVKDEARLPLDLQKGPLLRARLIRLDPGEHILLLTLHHIVFDGWSRRVFARELAALYEMFQSGKLSHLPALSLQYPDFVVWQRNHLKGKVLQRQLEYWKQQLSGAPASLNLLTDRPRPAVQSYRGSSYPVSLAAGNLDRVRVFAREHGASLFMVLLAAFQSVLARCSGDEDILIGTPIANRTQAKTEELIGLFANTLVLRANLAGDPTFAGIVGSAKQTALDAYAHQDVPFEKLVEEINPDRSLSHNPIFQVLFSLQNATQQAFELSGLDVKLLGGTLETAKFDLSIYLSESAEGIRGRIEYNTDLYDRETIIGLWRHYERLLVAGVENPELRLSELPLLDKAEQHLIVSKWNATEREYRRDACVQDLFSEAASRNPRKTAVVYGNRQLSYAELDERSNRLAAYLRERGAGSECLVGLLVSRSIEMVVALLGILKAGAAYVPIDPAYPKERIAAICDDTKMSFLVTERSLSELLPSLLPQTIYLDTDWTQISRSRATEAPRAMTSANLAYVIFTSGSTGRPKGVKITHGNLVNFLLSMAIQPSLLASDKLLAVTSLSFDIAALELYLPLITGATVLIASREQALDGRLLAEMLTHYQPSVLQATPATWCMLIESGWSGSPQLRALCGGESLTPELAAKLLPRCQELWNMYGPTETTVWSSIYKVGIGLEEFVPIGRPIANTRFYILDKAQQPVAVGVVGELYIGGEGVGLGYLERPELTEEKFLPDPFARIGRMYRTGDLAKFLPDGNVVCLGRTDNQVKIRGYRIELGEIETALLLHSGLQGCAVLVLEDGSGDKRLAAYYVSRPGAEVDSRSLRSYLKQSLPDYMVPGVFIQVDSIPLTTGGKIDRRALLKHVPAAPEPDHGGKPSDDFELVLLYLWRKLLGIQSFRITDNFFELGGHSLLLVRLGAMIEEEFEKVVPMSVLFKSPTIEQIAVYLREGISDVSGFFVPLKKGSSGVPMFLVHSIIGDVVGCRQLVRHLDPDQRVYGIQIPMEFRQGEWMSSVETIASRYVEELLKFEPRGPYNLGGWSAGAPIALEMARQLRDRGFDVPLLVSIDAAPANTGGGTPRSNPLYYLRLLGNLPGVLKMEVLGDFSWRKLAQRSERLRKRVIRRYSMKRSDPQMLVQYQIARFLGPAEYSESAKQFMAALYVTLQKYVPQRYGGKVLLYQTQGGSPFQLHEPDRKWKKIATDLEVVPVSGNHVTLMLGKHVVGLARHLNQRLAELRPRGPARNESHSVSIEVVAGENECSPSLLADVHQ